MKLEYTSGCTTFYLLIDDKPVKNYSKEELKNLLIKSLEILDKDEIINMLIDVVQTKGDYNYLYTCEDCNDSVCTDTLILE